MRAAIPNADRLPPDVREAFDFLLARINTTFQKEHTGDGAHQGWTTVAFDAAHYTGSGGMTWTVKAANAVTFKFLVLGTTMFVMGVWNTTTVAGTLGTTLKVKIPGGYVVAATARDTNQATDSGTVVACQVRVDAGSTTIDILRQDGANWSAATNTTTVRVHTFFEVQ